MSANVGFADREMVSSPAVPNERTTELAHEHATPPAFGIDSPLIATTFAMFAVAAGAAGIATAAGQGLSAAVGPLVAAVVCGAGLVAILRSSRTGKQAVWDERLDAVGLRGHERVLDVGCGRGLVTVALAKRVPRGSVAGVDIWRRRDLSGNTRENAERNLSRAGVRNRVEIVDADATDLPFDDGEFDLVTAGHTLHHLALAADRRDAMQELMRVTRPGGRVVIVDSGKTTEAQAWLVDASWEDIVRTRPSFACYPPVRTLTATKPARRGGRPKR